MIIRLAGKYRAIRLDTHVVKGCSATFYTQFELHWIKMAIMGRRIPDQSLLMSGGALSSQFKQAVEFVFS
jgi:hypothetical protein